MTTSKTLRLSGLLVALVIWAGCDSGVGPPPPVLEQPATEISGPELAVFKTGSMQTADYYAENLRSESIDVQVFRTPEGSDYDITDAGGSFRKKVSIHWNPGQAAQGETHEVALLARSENGDEEFAVFDIYVEN